MLSTEKNQNSLMYFTNPHSSYTAFKRIVHMLMFSICIGLIITLFLLFHHYQGQWLNAQTSQPGKALAKQYASLVAAPLQNNDQQTLISMVSKFADDPYVESVDVYNDKGVHLAPLAQHNSVITLLKENELAPTIYLENVASSEGGVVGYLRVVLDSEKLLVEPMAMRAQQEQLVIVLAILCFILGVYATRAFYKARTFIVERDQS